MLHALVDYHNETNSRNAQLKSSQDYLELLEAVVTDVSRSKRVCQSSNGEISFRLYGGWFHQDTRQETLDRRMLTIACGRLQRRWQKLRITASCADSPLADPDMVLRDTLRIKQRAPQLRVTRESHSCSLHPSCAIDALSLWVNGNCPQYSTCKTRRDIVLGWQGQKMVDAMLSADMFYIGTTTAEPVVIVSNDDDYVPSLIAARKLRMNAWVLYCNRRTEPAYLDYLASLDAVEVSK